MMFLVSCLVDEVPCPVELQVLLDSTASELLISGGFSYESFELAFFGVLLLWVTGFGVGLVIAQVRKLRVP